LLPFNMTVMAVNTMPVHLALLLIAQSAATGSPCATAAPATPPSSPCGTMVPKSQTTVTTTPAPTCESFTCPDGWKQNAKPESILCTDQCDKAMCCTVRALPCTTVTTTPAPTCGSFACPDGWSKKAEVIVCVAGQCNKATCCKIIVTTATTTPPPTCAHFTCPDGWTQNAKPESIACAAGQCYAATCCTITTTPRPSDPCAPTARKYEAKDSPLSSEVALPDNQANMTPTWAFPFFGVMALFSAGAFVALRVRRGQRSTQCFERVHPRGEPDGTPFLSDDELAAFEC